MGIKLGGTALNAMYFVASLQQKLRQISSILARDARYQSLFHHTVPNTFLRSSHSSQHCIMLTILVLKNPNIACSESIDAEAKLLECDLKATGYH